MLLCSAAIESQKILANCRLGLYAKNLRNIYKSVICNFTMVLDKIKRVFSDSISDSDLDNEYLEIDLEQEKKDKKVFVKLFVLKQYEDVNDILNSLREGYTIAIIDIKLLRQKDSIELKRAISKIKKTTDALEGSIAGFGENIVIVTPSFAKIHKEAEKAKQEKRSRFD